MEKQKNLQDTFLNRARAERVPLTLFLMNGFQLRAVLRAFDNFTVVLDSDGKQQLIYKHAISTIAPARAWTWGRRIHKPPHTAALCRHRAGRPGPGGRGLSGRPAAGGGGAAGQRTHTVYAVSAAVTAQCEGLVLREERPLVSQDGYLLVAARERRAPPRRGADRRGARSAEALAAGKGRAF